MLRSAIPAAPAVHGDPFPDRGGRQVHGGVRPFRGHEQVVFGNDEPSGLRCIIAIHSTALGPALGGTRFRAYASDDEALADVLALSEAMSYKNATAGLDHGGGKARHHR